MRRLLFFVFLLLACGEERGTEPSPFFFPGRYMGTAKSLQIVVDRRFYVRHWREGGYDWREVGLFEAISPGRIKCEPVRTTHNLSSAPNCNPYEVNLTAYEKKSLVKPDFAEYWVREIPHLFTEKIRFFDRDSVIYELYFRDRPDAYWRGSFEVTWNWMRLKIHRYFLANGEEIPEYRNYSLFRCWDIWDSCLYLSSFEPSSYQDAKFENKEWSPSMPVSEIPKSKSRYNFGKVRPIL